MYNHEDNDQVDVKNYLRKVIFPADKQVLISEARSQSAPDEILQILNDLPDRIYENIPDVEGEMV